MKKVKRPNGCGGIEKNKNGTYRIRIYTIDSNGEKRRITLENNIKSHTEAKRKLEKYNDNPYNVDKQTLLFEDVFKYFYEFKKNEVEKITLKGYLYDFKRCRKFHKRKLKDIEISEIYNFLNSLDCSYGTRIKTKGFLVQFYSFATIMGYINENRALNLKIKKRADEKKVVEINIFTPEDIVKLTNYRKEDEWIDVILIMLYTGYRIGEILSIKKEDVDMENCVIKGGNKTIKGKSRRVPIHNKIKKIVEDRMKTSTTEYLICNNNWKILRNDRVGKKIRTAYFREKFYKVMEKYGMNHKPHDTRKTLATKLFNADTDSKTIQDIMGHTSIKITEQYYIKDKEIEQIKEKINKID